MPSSTEQHWQQFHYWEINVVLDGVSVCLVRPFLLLSWAPREWSCSNIKVPTTSNASFYNSRLELKRRDSPGPRAPHSTPSTINHSHPLELKPSPTRDNSYTHIEESHSYTLRLPAVTWIFSRWEHCTEITMHQLPPRPSIKTSVET